MRMSYIINCFCLITIFTYQLAAQDYEYASMFRAKEDDYTEIECIIIPIAQEPQDQKEMNDDEHHISHPHVPGPHPSRAPSNFATSTNWGGYAAANKLSSAKKNSVSAVYGTWIVPTLESTVDDSYCAIWVGIDGYNSSTVEQIGTGHDFIEGTQEHYAWFEMYPEGAYLINGFPVTPGDVISASVTYAGNATFVLKLYNDTQQVFVTIPTQYTKSSAAQRKSAEWIVEAPWWNGVLPLSNFVTAYLWGCTATINGATAPIKNSKWQNIGIEMVTDNDIPKAIPSAILPDNGSFFMTWHHE